MARKQSAEAKILNLYDELSEDGQRIVFDLLRSKQQKKPAGKPSAGAKKRGVRPAGTQSSRRAAKKGLPQSTEGQTGGASSVAGGDDGSKDIS